MTGDDELIARLQAACYLYLIAPDDTELNFAALGLRGIDNVDGLAVLHRNHGQQWNQDGVFEDSTRQADMHDLPASQQPLLVVQDYLRARGSSSWIGNGKCFPY